MIFRDLRGAQNYRAITETGGVLINELPDSSLRIGTLAGVQNALSAAHGVWCTEKPIDLDLRINAACAHFL